MSGVSMRVTFDDAVLRKHLAALALAKPSHAVVMAQSPPTKGVSAVLLSGVPR